MQEEAEERNQQYGGVMKKDKMRWYSLQVKLRQGIYARLKEELRETESWNKVSHYEPEEGTILGE